ncbi:GDCCVxC domain-containing (seleno)protein [uncultured Hyphomonas sp.]|uniref:GDCCVxC domain-containing (seleno)protein n=1 Tax=uncultured Hyphomonas sp. TaxID=225298 RepID=UPI0030DBC00A
MAELDVTGDFIADSTLTCPECGHQSKDTMPTNACQFFHDCKGCGTVLKPNPGDCCVYCSFGDVACPPIQVGDCCGG